MTDREKICAEAAQEMAASFAVIMSKHGNYAAMLAGHLSNVNLILETWPCVKTMDDVEHFADIIGKNELHFIGMLCELLNVDSEVVTQIAKGMYDHSRLIRDDLKERAGIDADVVIPHFNQKGTTDGKSA